MDRMGNMITAYLTLLWMKLEFNYDVYLEKQSYLVSIFREAKNRENATCKN